MGNIIQFQSDQALIERIRLSDEQAFTKVYKSCKKYCVNFLKKNGADTETATDIFQDAMIVFYEKVQNTDMILKCSIQTYLNSVCRNRWLNIMRNSKEVTVPENFSFEEHITDWFDEFEEERERQIEEIKKALETMDAAGGKCKDILMLYFYEHKSMQEIATHFGYTTAANAKNQKARCQKRLKEMLVE